MSDPIIQPEVGNGADRFYTIFQLAPDGMSISRLDDGLFLEVNQGFSEMFGFSRDEVIGRTSYELHFWQDFLDRQKIVERLAGKRQIDNFQTVIVGRHGRQVSVLLSARTLKLEGQPCLLLSYKDVTTQSRALEALQESEKKFRDIFDTSPDSILITDIDGRVYDVNAAYESVSGYSRSESLGKTTLDIGLWPDRGRRTEFTAQLQEHGRVQNFETALRTKDGRIRAFLVSAKLITLGGAPLILSMTRDITDIRTAETALRENERKYRELTLELGTVLEGIPDGLVLWDADGKIIWANRNASIFLMMDDRQAIGKSCHSLFNMPEIDGVCLVRACLQQGQKLSTSFQGHDGRSWQIQALPIRGEQVRVEKVLTLASDITETTRLRAEADRSARLAAVGELAAGVAHEINNPNGLILMNLAMLQDVCRDLLPLLEARITDPDDLRLGGLSYRRALQAVPETISESIESGQRIRQIVAELKDFSRPALAQEFEPVDLNEAVRKTLRMLRPSINQATANFAVSYAENLPRIMGNQRQLEQVVVNLVMNACQALQEPSESLVVAVYRDEQSGNACLKVWDEGIGIEAELLPQVTDPFFTTRRETGGTGLGLSISARIIEEHGGIMTINSTPGYGTTVTVCFPLPHDEVNAP